MEENYKCEPTAEEKSLSISGCLMLAYVLLSVLCYVMRAVIFSAAFTAKFGEIFLLAAAAFLGIMLITGVKGPLMLVAAAPAAACFVMNIDGAGASPKLCALAQILIILFVAFFHAGGLEKLAERYRKLWWLPALLFLAGQLISFKGTVLRFYNIPYIAAALVLSGAYFMMLNEISRSEAFAAPVPEPYGRSFYEENSHGFGAYGEEKRQAEENPEPEESQKPEESWRQNASWNHGTDYNADGSLKEAPKPDIPKPDIPKPDNPKPRKDSHKGEYYNPFIREQKPKSFYQGRDYGINQNNTYKESKTPDSGEYVPIGKNALEDLRLYKQLLDEGILTQEEFDAKKHQILNL